MFRLATGFFGIRYKDQTPTDLLEGIYRRNIERYGDPYGSTIEWFQRIITRGSKSLRARQNQVERYWLLVMKLLLHSHDRFNDFAEFDPGMGDLAVYSKTQYPNKWRNNTAGFFAEVNKKPTLLFRVDHDLFFGYEKNLYSIADGTYARIEGGEIERKFTLGNDDGPILSIDYEIPRSPIPVELDFTQTEPEHFDFLLFVRNVLQNPARRKLA